MDFGLAIGIVGFLLVLVTGQVLLPPALQQSSVLTTFVNGTIIYGFLLLIPISIAMLWLRKDEQQNKPHTDVEGVILPLLSGEGRYLTR